MPARSFSLLTLPCLQVSLLGALGLCGCAHQDKAAKAPPHELWIPAQGYAHLDLEGRELWIDVELSGYTRQQLERYSDDQAEHDDEEQKLEHQRASSSSVPDPNR